MTDYDPLEGLDRDKVAEVALAMLALTIHDERRAWKGIDWDVMKLLHQKGWISAPRGKAKSVVLAEPFASRGPKNRHDDEHNPNAGDIPNQRTK